MMSQQMTDGEPAMDVGELARALAPLVSQHLSQQLSQQVSQQLAPRLQLEIAHALSPLNPSLTAAVQQAAATAAHQAASQHVLFMYQTVRDLQRQVSELQARVGGTAVDAPPAPAPPSKSPIPKKAAPAAKKAKEAPVTASPPAAKRVRSNAKTKAVAKEDAVGSGVSWFKDKRVKGRAVQSVVTAALSGDGSAAGHVRFDEDATDYAALPAMSGPPAQGDVVAFKRLVLGENWQPTLTDYCEAAVAGYDEASKVVSFEGPLPSLGEDDIDEVTALPLDDMLELRLVKAAGDR